MSETQSRFRISEREINEIRRLSALGLSERQIVLRMSVGRNTVRKVIGKKLEAAGRKR